MQGVVVYALSSALPLLVFGYLGPIIRKQCPQGFVLTEWTRQRYGLVTAIYLSILTYIVSLLFIADVGSREQIDHDLPVHGRRIIGLATNR